MLQGIEAPIFFCLFSFELTTLRGKLPYRGREEEGRQENMLTQCVDWILNPTLRRALRDCGNQQPSHHVTPQVKVKQTTV